MSKNIPSFVYWYSLKDPNPISDFHPGMKAKVVIVGGGMAGLSCAQRLIDSGIKSVIVEKDFCGAGASGKTSGFITPDSEIELSALLDSYGEKKAKKIWDFVISGVNSIRENIENYKIICDYQKQDSLFIANNSSGFKYVKKEHEARMKLGYESALYSKKDIKSIIGSDNYVGGVRYPDTFGMNSYLYCQTMKDILRQKGVDIVEKTAVKKIKDNGVETDKGYIQAENIIVCADRFIPDLGVLKKEIYHVQTFLGITKPLTDEEVKKIFPNDLVMTWDTDLVYNYFRLTSGNRLLIGGGDLIYTYAKNLSKNTKRFGRRLKNYMKKKFPDIIMEIDYLWPGMLGVSKDLLPIMGTDAKNKNIFYVGAATGLPWASAMGKYAAERLISGRDDFEEDFSPNRKFILGSHIQSVIGNPPTYAISHGLTKYF